MPVCLYLDICLYLSPAYVPLPFYLHTCLSAYLSASHGSSRLGLTDTIIGHKHFHFLSLDIVEARGRGRGAGEQEAGQGNGAVCGGGCREGVTLVIREGQGGEEVHGFHVHEGRSVISLFRHCAK